MSRNDFYGVKGLGTATKITSVGDLIKKLEHFSVFCLNYVNL